MMTPTNAAFDELTRRLETLEARTARLARHNAWLVRILLVTVAVAVSAVVASYRSEVQAQARPRGRVVEAERFIVRDAKGKIRAVLGNLESGPGLALMDPDEKERVALGVALTGPVLTFRDTLQNEVLSIASLDKGESGLLIRDKKGKPQLSLGSNTGGAGLQLSDDAGKMKASVSIDFARGAGFEVYDKAGKRRAALLFDAKLGSGLDLRDEAGNPAGSRP
jgi:hypothetical protein